MKGLYAEKDYRLTNERDTNVRNLILGIHDSNKGIVLNSEAQGCTVLYEVKRDFETV